MVRYAAHRVYLQIEGRMLVRQMVELDAEGYVDSLVPFSMEVHHTVWIDGIIIVAPLPPLSPMSHETFAHYTQRVAEHQLHESVLVQSKRMRAYRTVGFDIPAMRFANRGALSPLS